MKRTCKEMMDDLIQTENIYKDFTRKAMRAVLEYARYAIIERAEQRTRAINQGSQIRSQAIGTRAERMYELRDRLWKKTFEDYEIINMLYNMEHEL